MLQNRITAKRRAIRQLSRAKTENKCVSHKSRIDSLSDRQSLFHNQIVAQVLRIEHQTVNFCVSKILL